MMINFEREQEFIAKRTVLLIKDMNDQATNGMVCAEDSADMLRQLAAATFGALDRIQLQMILNESKRR